MGQISKLQLYCALAIFTAPIAFLETPRRMFEMAGQDAWLAVIASIIPGILIVMLFSQLIQKSRQPFPLMLEEHLGKVAGKALSFIYILIFIFLSSYTIRMFV
ncbi:MAG TPA: GerAB/ArcD/ProY family transporter, partial [Syntrophomonadaceae bacterium]|nr:GerAB/ArcD/ProY family transporter [Syntrophomonadaceae bacterium]